MKSSRSVMAGASRQRGSQDSAYSAREFRKKWEMRTSIRLQPEVEPRPGVGPEILRGPDGDAQSIGRLGHGHATEEPELDQNSGVRIGLSESVQGVVDGEKLFIGARCHNLV